MAAASVPGTESTLTAKQARFVDEYLIDLNASQASIRAGYSPKNADVTGPRLVGNIGIAAAIAERQAALAERFEVTQEWIIEKLVGNVERSCQAVPVLDHEGCPTGEWRYEGSVANRALELLGKHLGMFTDRVHHSGSVTVFTVDAVDAEIAQLAAELNASAGNEPVPEEAHA